ncbi:MAG: PAS domain S-box protein [Candidatus Anstonellaceae archaeon]
MKLRTLMLFATIVTMLLVGAVFFYGRGAQIDFLVRQALADQTEREVLQADQLAQFYLSTAMSNLQQLSISRSVARAVANSSDAYRVGQVSSDLDSMLRFQPSFEGVGLYNSGCILVASSSNARALVGRNLSFRDYCAGSRKSDIYVSGGFISLLYAVPTFGVTAQVKDTEGKYAGFAFAAMNTKFLYEYFRKIHSNSSAGYTLLFDKDGKTLIDTRIPLEETALDSNNRTYSAIAGNREASGILDLEGDLVGFRRSQYFTVAVVHQAAEAEQLKDERVRTLLELSILVSLVMLAIGILQTYAVSRHLRPLFADLSETKKAEKELMEHKDFFQNVITQSPVATYVVDTKGKIVVINKLAEKLAGYPLSEVAGKHFSKFVKETSLIHIISAFNRVLGGKTVKGLEVELVKKNGETYKVVLDATPMMKDGKVEYVVATGTLPPKIEKKARLGKNK